MKKINDLLNNKYENHIFPFLWMHGEEEDVIRDYIGKIYSAGIKSVCIESRPHKDFLKEKWWQDVDVIIEECEKREMKIWIVDDKHFPTGYAAGEVKKNHPCLQKEFLDFKQLDFRGPKKNSGIILDWITVNKRPNIMSVGVDASEDATLSSKGIFSIIAAPKIGFGQISEQGLIDVTDKIKGNTLYWDIPAGEWTLFFFYRTHEGGEASTQGYLNPLIGEATDVLINTVHRAHYERYKEKFGRVIKGFFSDEPRFGNIKGPDAAIGKIDMPFPWREGLELELAERMQCEVAEVIRLIPYLLRGDSSEVHKIRYHYMDLVSNLYSKNFSQRIGNWCKERGIEYIGHVIEDNNAHSRLGYGSGHFFRSMAGQTMSGIDVVLHQLMPQFNNGYFKAMTSTGWDGEFFHYALAKMGASLGYLDSSKNGNTMCEVYGAYGWSEGVKFMKWITDHMLVRGVNHFVPHAFSMKKYPDPDCPPHFYGHGSNIQFPYFKYLMDYTNRISELFTGGKHCADVAVLYHAEAEWSGKYMEIQKPTRILTENQVEFEIVSLDMVVDAEVRKDEFFINQYSFKILIVPLAERLPINLIKKLKQLAEQGIKVVFVGKVVEAASENLDASGEIQKLSQITYQTDLENLMSTLSNEEIDCLTVNESLPYLRYFHYQQDGESIFMLFNENSDEDISFIANFPTNKKLKIYDAMENKLDDIFKTEAGYPISLAKAETMILFEVNHEITEENKPKELKEVIDLTNSNWKINLYENIEDSNQQFICESLPVLGIGDQFENFAGALIYETKVLNYGMSEIIIEDAVEIVSVFINNEKVGTKISQPYKFDLSDKLIHPSNSLRIEVVNNLGRLHRDYLSQFMLLEPVGITGKVELKVYE